MEADNENNSSLFSSRASTTDVITDAEEVFDAVNQLTDTYFTLNLNNESPTEFLQSQNVKRQIVAEIFVAAMYREKFLTKLAQRFKLKKESKLTIPYLCFHLYLFELDMDSLPDILETTYKWSNLRSKKILEYLLDKDSFLEVVCIANQIYDNDYVSRRIVSPVVENRALLQYMYDTIVKRLKLRSIRQPAHVTRAISPECLRRSKLTAPIKAPPPTPHSMITAQTKLGKVPITTFHEDVKIKQALEAAKAENHNNARKLLYEAQNKVFKCAIPQKKLPPPAEKVSEVCQFRVKPVNKKILKSQVSIKQTAATTLRDAEHIVSKHQKEINRLESLMSGAFDSTQLEELEAQIRQEQYETEVKEIERKHLQGLLTREEAAIAKINVLKQNKCKAEQIKKEREKLFKDFESWKEKQREITQAKVDKVIEIELASREATKLLIEKKLENAKVIDNESKQNMLKIEQQRQEELNRKIELVAEIRAIQSLRNTLEVPKFDPTECSNVGLLCEMSLTELQERLCMIKVKLMEEIDERRKKIHVQKQQRNKLLEDAKTLVANDRAYLTTKSSLPKIPTCLSQIKKKNCINNNKKSDIDELRAKLMKKRDLRMKLVNNINTPCVYT